MKDLLICNMPDGVIEMLERRAEKHGRTFEQELVVILSLAALQPEGISAFEELNQVQQYFKKQGRIFEDSTPLIREDRER